MTLSEIVWSCLRFSVWLSDIARIKVSDIVSMTFPEDVTMKLSEIVSTPQSLYNTVFGVQAHFRVSYPNCVISRVKCIGCIRKRVLNSHSGSNLDPCYNQNHVIKRFRCIRLSEFFRMTFVWHCQYEDFWHCQCDIAWGCQYEAVWDCHCYYYFLFI